MKLIIINGENNDEKLEIHVNDYSMVEDIKYKLDEILNENGNFIKDYYKLIYKNIILSDDDSIKSNKILENDEIWFGKIDKYLRKDDVIVDVFILGRTCGGEYLIMKKNDTILSIKSIIERISPGVTNIWDADGNEMKNDQIVTEIDTFENYKLFIRFDDEVGNEINYTFDDFCYIHDTGWVDRYLFYDQIRDDNKTESIRTILINLIDQVRQIITSNNIIDDGLKQNLSDFPFSFLNATNLFCIDMTDRILNLCDDYWMFVMNQFEDDVVKIFVQYFYYAIHAALWDFSNIRQINNEINKSVREIIIDALDYFVKYLNDSSKDWRYWLKLFIYPYLMGSFSDSYVNERIDEKTINKFTIKLRIKGKDKKYFTPFRPETITDAKQSISAVYNVDMKHLYCIKPGGDNKPNDEDDFDDEFIIEIVLTMDDIEKLRSIGEGSFAKIYLYRDKISNKQFVLKKAIRNDGDLYRNINIYSKLNLSRNIMNYSGLFKNEKSFCIGMEYMPGGSLRSYLDKGKHLSEQEIVKISYEILTQINELHKSGIIHRDIKSNNIVIDEHNHAKLIDFGLSKYTIGLTSKDLSDKLKEYAPGTINYMAPELIKEEPYSEKIDIWSFGMVMVEMVTGKIPFHWLKEFEVFPKIKDCTKYEFVPIFPISNEFNQFITSCLNTNPDERPNVEQLIKSELFIDYLNN